MGFTLKVSGGRSKNAVFRRALYIIQEAKNLIVSGNRSISEIAYRLGFENPPYFSRLFKKETGMSPKEYKNRLQN
jgi:AraC family transcriptional regulator, transcriptional activator of pobA